MAAATHQLQWLTIPDEDSRANAQHTCRPHSQPALHRCHYSRVGGASHWRNNSNSRFACAFHNHDNSSALRRCDNGNHRKKSVWVRLHCNPSSLPTPAHTKRVSRRDHDDPHPASHDVCRKNKRARNEATSAVVSLWACTKNKDLYRGTRLHEEILKKGLLDKCSGALVTMYAKCGALVKAKALLDMHKIRDVIPWTALLAAYVRERRSNDAFECFEHMQHEGITPNAVTYACMLKACGTIGAADKGKQIHDEITRQGLLQNDIVLSNALVDMYAKSGALAKAHSVLEELPTRDVISWNTLITGYVQQGQGEQALNCFEHMQCDSISPNAVTYACILKACGTIGNVDKGTQIHDEIVRMGLLQNDIVLGNALVDMYAKCGALSKARRVLEELPSRDVVSWNTLITGYAQQGQGEQALQYFEHMQSEGIPPNAVTFSCILNVCGSLGAADKGKQIHDEVVKQGLLQDNAVLGGALVDMYAKCGALAKAQSVLEELPSRDVISWSALIAGYAQQGQGEQAMYCFERMQNEGTPPNAVTLCSVLNACSHLGLVEEGHMFFVNMSRKYGLKPNLEAYACMIDLYGRAGHLERAVKLIREMPTSDYSAIWHALLGACLRWGDVQVGRWAFERALQVDIKDGALYVLMANIYAAADMQENARSIEAMRTENGAGNKPGCSPRISYSRDWHALSVGNIKHG